VNAPVLPPGRWRRFRTRVVRRAVLAPELERYLSRRHVDLAVTDQLEALQVRVRAGLDTFQRRLDRARAAARARGWILTASLAAGVLLLALGGPWLRIPTALVTAASAIALGRLVLDRIQLRRLHGRYRGRVDACRTADELLNFAEEALAEARALGAAPELK
jgi:hypothetical protein